MNSDIIILCGTAVSIGFIHTVFGPDHYLPFVVMGRARRWSLRKTAWVTFFCGLGHVLSSVVLGLIGVVLGVEVMKLEMLEGFRGAVTAWLLIGFGLAYFVWGVHRAVRNRPHRHVHTHGDGHIHDHVHSHHSDHAHVHDADGRDITPWVLFTIFVFGPCEPLIPILMYPAAKSSAGGVFLVAGLFGVTTIGTMLAIVVLSSWGVSFANLGRLNRYAHALAGATICISGLCIQFLGL
ncbi:MAG: sulfite exporter TauE/SafE family protein [Candidatus Latescibacterota bacterium]|nr:MAG: sulfite exporter TauE/SafE family protein [Candidatus Latescibacterota bacterium]